VLDDLNRITGIFFTGGDQDKHRSSFINSDNSDSEEMKVIRKRVDSGDCAVAGTSAGTAVQGGPSSS
jgi:cyanophycinase-like exopeptidase